MQPNELIDYIVDNDKIEDILNSLGCHHLKDYSKEYRCGLPEHNNTTSVSIKKDNLKVRIYQSDDEKIWGNIFTLVMNIKQISFPKSLEYIHNLLGLEYKKNFKSKDNKEYKKNPLEIFSKVRKKIFVINKDEIDLQDETILKEYTPYPHIDWIREGIMPRTCEKFRIGYSYDKKRIVIPERYWSGTEEDYLGIMGRTTIKEWEMLDIPKYFPLKPYFKGMNLYGLQENYESIQKSGYVVVFEAQKSVLKRHSRLDETGVAIGSHDITDEQVRVLIGLDVDIIIAMDKGVNINHVRAMCNKFYGIRPIYYIYDNYDLLKDKESPADALNKIYNYLLKYKTKYDESERKKYLEWVEKQENNLSK